MPYSKDRVKFINKAILQYLSHKKKKAKLTESKGGIIKQKLKKNVITDSAQPEVNIGLIGLC